MDDELYRPVGTAFPCATARQVHEVGMLLRDWFAGQALMGFLTFGYNDNEKDGFVASRAYHYADTMMKERERGR